MSSPLWLRLADRPLLLGFVLGLVFGVVDLVFTWVAPLSDDSIPALLRFYGPMFAAWGAVAFRAASRRGRLSSGIVAGCVVAFGTFCVFYVLNLLRVNLFLEELTGRADWQDMVRRFRASGSDSLRVFVNVEYLKGAPFKIGVASVIGTILGLVGGTIGRLTSTPHQMAALVALVFLAAGRPLGAEPCLRYAPDTVQIAGTLSRHTFYGAPGFGEDPKHDAKETGFYLDLAAPVCRAVGRDDGDVAKTGIRRIQLVLDAAGYDRLRPFLGKRVTLRGTLSGAITGHHHAPVLLDVEKPARGEPVQAAIDAYRVAIQAAQNDPARGHLEAAFNAIAPLRHALLLERGGNRSRLESMSEQEFARLGLELVGLLVSRDEALMVEPDVAFFGRLAARGDAADRAFFAALRSTYPQSAWPVYVEQQTDVSGCTRFGSGTLVSTYLAWAAVGRQYPKRYDKASSEYLSDVFEALTESTCACADRASVERELTEFSRRVADSAARTRAAARLDADRSGSAKMRYTCKSG